MNTINLLNILKERFEKNKHRHAGIAWSDLQTKLEQNPEKLHALNAMEQTGGEPDVIGFDEALQEYIFCDCAPESPIGRRSLCYDPAALASRKQNKPRDSALGMATAMGVDVLDEDQYRTLCQFGAFDQKSSSWIKTPDSMRLLGGALFGDCRYDRVFLYHNGVESYYASRGFRAILKV